MGIFGTKNLNEEQIKKYKRSLREITKDAADNFKNKYVRNDLVEKIIKNCGGVKNCKNNANKEETKEQRKDFRLLLGFKENDLFITKEESVLNKITKIFSREEII